MNLHIQAQPHNPDDKVSLCREMRKFNEIMQKISDKDPKQDVLAVRKHGTSYQRNTGMYFATARS